MSVNLGYKDLEFETLELQKSVNLLRGLCLMCWIPKIWEASSHLFKPKVLDVKIWDLNRPYIERIETHLPILRVVIGTFFLYCCETCRVVGRSQVASSNQSI